MSSIVFSVRRYEKVMYEMDGDWCEDEREADENAGGEQFDSLRAARAWMVEAAISEKVEVRDVGWRGSATVTRAVYELEAVVYDDELEEYMDCEYDGIVPEHQPAWDRIDLLDLHPEVRRAWQRSTRSDWTIEGALELYLGENWRELPFIDFIE